MRAPVQADVHADAVDVISTAATAAYPRETGGLLVGWWDTDRVVVRYAIVVPDATATDTSWNREQTHAQAALDSALAEHQHPWLGYVGDWHSHPAPCGPSRQDLTSIRRASRQYTQPLILLVHRSDGALHHLAAHRGRMRTVTAAPLS